MCRLIARVAVSLLAVCICAWDKAIHRVESDPQSGTSNAVLVTDVPLVHTFQIFPTDEGGNVVGTTAAEQFSHLMTNVRNTLEGAASGMDRVVKLNLYVTSEAVAVEVRSQLAQYLSGNLPAVSFVVTRLPREAAFVAADAVAVSNARAAVGRKGSHAVLPAGAKVFISGQAEKGELAEATSRTLASLSATLRYLGLGDEHVVQLKCFVQPINRVRDVERAIAEHFAGQELPPVTFVEWSSSLPIEIEVVASAGAARADRPEVEFLTPDGFTASPLYSRVARVNHGGLIFIGDVFGRSETDATAQVTEAFERLRRILEKTGGDFNHLAKATYYVVDDEISKRHNEVRPKYYDPASPPAASKALVAGTGRPGVRYVMDMIAVPANRGMPDSPAELGLGLSATDVVQGWISLFDGRTTFGWTGATVDDDGLAGGTTTTRFGDCELRAAFARPGTVFVGRRELRGEPGKPLVIQSTGHRDTIRIGSDTKVQTIAVRPLGMKKLWNGQDLAGWRLVERDRDRERRGADSLPPWSVLGSTLRAVGGPAALEYESEKFGDAVIQLAVRTRAVHSNGGVFFRSIPGDFMNGYEAQLHNRCVNNDPAQPFRYTTGGIDDRQDARHLVSRDFEPFVMTIIADGPHIATWVNGFQTTDWTDERAAHVNPRKGLRLEPGTIQLQAHDPATDFEVLDVRAREWGEEG